MRFWSNKTFPRAVSTCPVCGFSGVIGFLRKVERVLDPLASGARAVLCADIGSSCASG